MWLIQGFFGNSGTQLEMAREPLSKAFQRETKIIHAQVERHEFVTLILSDCLESSQYHQHLTDLSVVYQALEDGLRLNLGTRPELKNIYFNELCRADSLKQDLDSCDFRELSASPSKFAVDYASYLEELAANKPFLLIAHAYVRYLGDLSGGMILKKHVEHKWPSAVQFYNFSTLLETYEKKNAWAFKDYFKEKLDQLPLSDCEFENLIQEAQTAFELSGKLFDAALLT